MMYGEQMRVGAPFKPLLLVLAAALVVGTALFASPGHLTWDSGTYHLMVRTLFETGGFFVANGYDDLSSPLLAVGQTMVKDGNLVSQYPEYYTILSLPFYALFGYRGLPILNSLAFVGTCMLIWRMSRWFSDDRNAPVAAVVVYAFATYALEYTQSSYPHLTSTFLICVSAWLLWGAALEKDDLPSILPSWVRKADTRCALAGVVFGVAIGVRLDSAFAGLAIALPLLAFRTLGWRVMATCGFGILVSLSALVWINAIKFGTFLPFSYGRENGGYTGSLTSYVPGAVMVALGLALVAWHRVRPIRPGRWTVAVVLIAIAIALSLTSYGQRLIHGLFQIVVDMRIRPEIPEPALSRSPGGAVVYWGNVKKSLLESCPYLILIVIPAVRGFASGTYGSRWLLWLVPAGFVGFYGYLAWHGSVGWNMRYLNPALPFLALLASHELLRNQGRIPAGRLSFWIGSVALWAGLVIAFLSTRGSLGRQEVLILDGSLLLVALLLSCQVMELAFPQKLVRIPGSALSAMLVVALVWSSALTFGADYLVSSGARSVFRQGARDIQMQIKDDALIMTFQPDYVWGLLDTTKKPIVANYALGTEQDAVELVQAALDHRPVYWLSPPSGWDSTTPAAFGELEARNIRVEPIPEASRFFRLYELRMARPDR